MVLKFFFSILMFNLILEGEKESYIVDKVKFVEEFMIYMWLLVGVVCFFILVIVVVVFG